MIQSIKGKFWYKRSHFRYENQRRQVKLKSGDIWQTVFKGWNNPPIVGRAVISVVLIAAYFTFNGSGGNNLLTRKNGIKVKDIYRAEIVKEYPHDHLAYTQGLFFSENAVLDHDDGRRMIYDNVFYESTGKVQKLSDIRVVDLESGKVLKQTPLDQQYFAEGLVFLNNKIYQLTWRSNKGFIYDPLTLHKIGEFTTPLTDGWGLTTDGKHLIATDSTHKIYYMDPDDKFKIVRQIEVTESVYGNRTRVPWVNELDYIEGEIWANLYMKDCIVRIDPATGNINSWVMLENLKRNALKADNSEYMDVLNGIAYDPVKKRLFVTGKNWPKLYEIKLVRRRMSYLQAEQSVADCIPRQIPFFF